METVRLNADKVNLVWSTDWHLSATPPGRRADDYQSAILGKLEFIRELTDRVSGVGIGGGDVFHIKNSRHPANSLGLLINALCLLRKFPTGRVYGAVGNHDLALGERMDSLSGQPLGLFIAAGAYFNLSEEPVMFVNSTGSISVTVESYPFDHAEETLRRMLVSRRHPDATHRVAIAHTYGAPGSGSEFWGEKSIGYKQLEGTDFDYILWGHDHSRIEPVQVGKPWHLHYGSLARAALDTDQTDRPVVAAVLSFSDAAVLHKEIMVPTKPLAETFVVADKAVRAVEKSEEMKDFLAKMDEAVEGVEASDPAEALRLLCPDNPELLSLARELCGL